MLDSSLNTVSRQDKLLMSSKVVEREQYSNYIYPPLKYGFRKFVRIVGYILLATRKFKLGMVTARQARGIPVSDGSTVESLSVPPPKFSVFTASDNLPDDPDLLSLHKVFNVYGFGVSTSKGVAAVRLSDRDLSLSLEYMYKKAAAEVMQFNDKKIVQRIGILLEDIVYCKSRVEEGQALRAVGGLENFIDLRSFTGIDFNVPVIDRYSPIAVSLAYHLHYNVVKHRGSETTFRM